MVVVVEVEEVGVGGGDAGEGVGAGLGDEEGGVEVLCGALEDLAGVLEALEVGVVEGAGDGVVVGGAVGLVVGGAADKCALLSQCWCEDVSIVVVVVVWL